MKRTTSYNIIQIQTSESDQTVERFIVICFCSFGENQSLHTGEAIL